MVRRFLTWLCVLGFTSGSALASDLLPAVSDDALAPAVREMCAKKIVFLGEDANHAGAQTIAIKARLVETLVTQCGFKGIVFESQFYDMLDFQHSLEAGTATQSQLASAIGALWSRYAVFQSFETWLFQQVVEKRVLIAGVDPQVGGIGARYSPQQLPTDLAAVLGRSDEERCREAMTRHGSWTYDDAHPFDNAAFDTLQECVREINASLALHAGPDSSRLAAMASSYLAYLSSIDPHGADAGARDKAMYQNLAWQLSRWPRGTRVVVWTASVHASRAPIETTGHGSATFGTYARQASGEQVYTLGFSALGGAYGSTGGRGASHDLPAPPPGSLEASAFASAGKVDEARFLSARALSQLGSVPGRAFSYGAFQTRTWSDYLDGILVLRYEKAAAASP